MSRGAPSVSEKHIWAQTSKEKYSKNFVPIPRLPCHPPRTTPSRRRAPPAFSENLP